MFANASKSGIVIRGLPIVSAQTSRVFSVIAASTAGGSVMSTNVTAMPDRLQILCSRR